MNELIAENLAYYAGILCSHAEVVGDKATVGTFILLDLKNWVEAYRLDKLNNIGEQDGTER